MPAPPASDGRFVRYRFGTVNRIPGADGVVDDPGGCSGEVENGVCVPPTVPGLSEKSRGSGTSGRTGAISTFRSTGLSPHLSS